MTINIASLKRKINILLLYIFFLHGVLYYAYPFEIHDTDSSIKLIKYIIIIIFSTINIFNIKIKKAFVFLIISTLLFLLMKISHSNTLTMSSLLNRLFTYIFPLTIIFLKNIIQNLNLSKKHIIILLIITLSFAFLEFFFFSGIFAAYNFEQLGFRRVVSIFINPNNAGLMIFVLLAYSNPFSNVSFKNLFLFIILSALSIVVIIFTGSRTPIFIGALFLLFYISQKAIISHKINKKNTVNFLKISFLCALIYIIYLFISPSDTNEISNTRDFKQDSWSERFEQIDIYVNKVRINFLSPDYETFSITYDNAYMQFWSDFSIIGIMCLLLILSYLIMKRQSIFKRSVILSLLIAGFSINIFYLWPTTYVIWYILLSNEKIQRL